MKSFPPPGEVGTTIRTGLTGYDCAIPLAVGSMKASERQIATRNCLVFIALSPRLVVILRPASRHALLAGRPAQGPPAQDVQVQVKYALSRLGAVVDDEAECIPDAEL